LFSDNTNKKKKKKKKGKKKKEVKKIKENSPKLILESNLVIIILGLFNK
jgi:hypothetical protein